MIKNRNLHPDARFRRGISPLIDVDQAADIKPACVAFDPDHDIKVCGINVAYIIDGNTGSGLVVSIGVAGALTRYGTFTTSIVAADNAAGKSAAVTLTNGTTLLAKGVPLLVTCSATTGTNIGECQIIVCYEVIDKAAS